jgi:hypothetical protein
MQLGGGSSTRRQMSFSSATVASFPCLLVSI